MNASQLKRAQNIVDGIAWCREALSYQKPYNQSLSIKLTKPNLTTGYDATYDYALSPAIREQAFRMFRREVEAKLAAYQREAAQLGLNLNA